ncbi:MAG: hypothetical protein ACYSU7_05915 [Planctomycetota bacterium]
MWCRHAGDFDGGGCAIYETRPQACRDFACSWLRDEHGLLLDGDRPDKLGVVFWVKLNGGIDAATRKPVNVLVAMETHKGAALQSPRAREIIERFRARGIPVSIGCGEELWAVQLTRDGRLMLDAPVAAPPPEA